MSIPPPAGPASPTGPAGPTAVPEDHDSDDEPSRVEWAQEELAILETHLDEFRGKSKNERYELLNTTVVPKMKKVYKGKDWKLRKQV